MSEAAATKPQQFRKKPVEIAAIQLTKCNWDAISQFLGMEEWRAGKWWENPLNNEVGIVTLEGTMIASADDWIIKGIRGEFYPCKPDIFAESYEPASAPLLQERVQALEKALRSVLPRLAHKPECMICLPTEEWAERGSWVVDECKCGIAEAERVLQEKP